MREPLSGNETGDCWLIANCQVTGYWLPVNLSANGLEMWVWLNCSDNENQVELDDMEDDNWLQLQTKYVAVCGSVSTIKMAVVMKETSLLNLQHWRVLVMSDSI
jgi:hypothetical protein